jgi:Putative beta-barrel porin-2, OmpL-like. bbp2
MRQPWRLGLAFALSLAVASSAFGQTTAPAPDKTVEQKKEAEKKEEEKPKTLWEEHTLFAYVENSYTWNLGKTSKGRVNDFRLYDFDDGYTFNIAEFSIKKDPSERYPFGYGLVLSAGMDSQKNHALGIFRDDDDQFAFRNTPRFDLQEAYISGRIPIGNGLVLKGGKFVTLLGYEVIEAPNNLNFSRGYLFTLSIPLTHVGGLAQYQFTDWFTMTVGGVVGWDVAKDNNGAPSWTGQFAFIPFKDFAATLNWIAGPEQVDEDGNPRTVLDFVFTYTGFKGFTLAANVDYGWEYNEPTLKATRGRSTTANWQAYAGYVAYDWTDKLRTAVRGEIFRDEDGARTLGTGANVTLYEVTATVQYKIWKGLMGRLEYRHDQASRKVFAATGDGTVPTRKYQDTIAIALDYLFF